MNSIWIHSIKWQIIFNNFERIILFFKHVFWPFSLFDGIDFKIRNPSWLYFFPSTIMICVRLQKQDEIIQNQWSCMPPDVQHFWYMVKSSTTTTKKWTSVLTNLIFNKFSRMHPFLNNSPLFYYKQQLINAHCFKHII